MQIIALDWANEKTNIAIFDGKKFLKALPSVKACISKDITIITENIPLLKAREYLDAGIPILCLNTWDVKQERESQGLDKTHENDAKVLYEIYQRSPEKFRPFKLDPNIFRIRSMVATFKDIQEDRKRAGNRLYSYRDEHSDIRLQELKKEERKHEKEMEKELQHWPIYTDFLENMRGVGPKSAITLMAYTGDIERFATVSSLWAYFGLHTVSGKAPRKTKGQIANWHQAARSHILGAMAIAFFAKKEEDMEKYKECPYMKIFLAERKRQVPLLLREFPDYDEKKASGHAYMRAKRKSMKAFIKDYFLAYKRLGGYKNTAVVNQDYHDTQGADVITVVETKSRKRKIVLA